MLVRQREPSVIIIFLYEFASDSTSVGQDKVIFTC